MRFLIPCLVVAATLLGPPARDVPQLPAGTAVLSGSVVVDEPNGQPIRRAFITVILGDGRQYQTSTDDGGRFTVSALPAGNVRLIAAKPGYVQTYYGARQPGSTVGLPVALTSGEMIQVTVQLPRGAVIAGSVKDEQGQPMPGISVRVQRVAVSASGQRIFTSTPGGPIQTTDDRGAFRLYGFAAGDYVVSAVPRIFPGADIRPTTAAELQWADRQLGGGPGGTPVNVANSTAGPAPGQTVTYAAVFFPGTVSAAAAGIVSLAAGQERSGLDLRMQFVPTAHVDGIVLNPSGQPATGVQLSLLPKDDAAASQDVSRLALLMDVGLGGGTAARTDSAGAFSFAGVEPGAYFLLARTGPPGRGAAPIAGGSTTQWAMTDVDVNGRDVTGLSLRLAAGQIVSGRFAFEGSATPATPARASIVLTAADARGFSSSAQLSLTSVNDPFEIAGLIPASYRVSAAFVPGWSLKSVTAGGRDVTDIPLEIKPGEDLTGVVVTFTDSPALLTGVLYDGANRPSSDLSIVLFSADRAMWFAGSRRVKPVLRPASDGRFTFGDLPPGDYYLAAVTDASPADLASAQFLEQVVPAALRITIAAGEKKTQDLKIAR